MTMSLQAVSVAGVSKSYSRGLRRPPVKALDAVDLVVEPGEIFGLLGPNGAGKTTLLKILLGLVSPGSGQASILGLPVSLAASREFVGYLPENHQFPGFLTANQMLDIYGRMSGVSKPDRRSRIPELLDLVSMSRWADTRIKAFSKGMLQRVGIAQALVNDPALLFLDEPTDGVDPVGRKDIRDILLELRTRGKTIFVNSHLLSEIEQVCTRVAIMNFGRIVKEGTVASITDTAPGYVITVSSMPPELSAAWSLDQVVARRAGLHGVESYAMVGVDRAGLNRLLDELRALNVEIEAVEPVRQTLEDYFIEVVGREATP